MEKQIIYLPIQSGFAEVSLPASKSISNRLLIMKCLSDQKIKIKNLSEAADTRLMASLLQKIDHYRSQPVTNNFCVLDCENAGTVIRFLTALLSLQPGQWLLTGSERMQQRPLKPLCDALRSLGATIEYTGAEGYPPVKISGSALKGGTVNVDASESSQYITALMLIAPCLEQELTIALENNIASWPYIRMTRNLMQQAGITASASADVIRIAPGAYKETSFFVEPDWSSASYWYELVALLPGLRLLLRDLKLSDLQGDSVLADIYTQLGVETKVTSDGIEIKNSHRPVSYFAFDFTDFPDLAPAVAATCAGLNMDAQLTGLENLVIKESNRLEVLYLELSKIFDGIEIAGKGCLKFCRNSGLNVKSPPRFRTYGDHRMAMALAPLAAKYGKVMLENPEVVAKSYPKFWDQMLKAGVQLL